MNRRRHRPLVPFRNALHANLGGLHQALCTGLGFWYTQRVWIGHRASISSIFRADIAEKMKVFYDARSA
jgi:hypothetical protein